MTGQERERVIWDPSEHEYWLCHSRMSQKSRES